MSALSFAEKTSFKVIVELLEKISEIKGHKQKEAIMKSFISSFHQKKGHKEESFYPILRLLVPGLEKERVAYGIKQHVLARIYIRILCLAKQGPDALKLTNYKSTFDGGKLGDFAEAVYWVLKSRHLSESKLTVHEVHTHLDKIAAKEDQKSVDNELTAMILNMSAEEQKWLVRILLKNLHIGVTERKILRMFHPDANDLFDVNNNLYKVCEKLKDPTIRLNEIDIEIFDAFKPMLCQQCDVQETNTEIKGAAAYYVEIKFDGERFQLHYKNGEFKYFSRNGYDYTDRYGCNSSVGILTPELAKHIRPDVKSCILDGEMMCWNTRKKCFTTKGANIDVKKLKVGTVHQPCFVVFDILLLNDQVVTNKPLSERFKILEEIIQPEEGILQISAKQVVTNGTEIIDILNQAIENCEEGIVVKNPSSVYKVNARKGGWYKIKPEYTEGMMTELDMIIIGGFYGDGRRKGVISQFLLGVADPQKNEKGEPTKFYSVGRVGSGYSDEELEELNRKLSPLWKRVKGTEKPENIEWTKEKPDLWIKPKDSFILQVKATELIPSDSFKVGYTVRFPRVKEIRYDKPWYDCLTVDDFTAIRQANCGKLTAEFTAKLNEEGSKRRTKRTIKKPSLDESCSAKKLRNAEMISALFLNKEMSVQTGFGDEFSKTDLELKIVEHGGTVVQHPDHETYCVIAESMNVRVNNIAVQKRFDIAKPVWLIDCINKNVLRKWRPDDLLVMSPKTSEMFSQEYDSSGDSYFETIDLIRLRQLISSIKINDGPRISSSELIQLEKEVFKKRNKFAIFRGYIAYFHPIYEGYDQKYQAPLLRVMFEYMGGTVASEINHKTTHVITFSNEKLVNYAQLKTELISNKTQMVDSEWISESWKAKKCLPCASFTPRKQ